MRGSRPTAPPTVSDADGRAGIMGLLRHQLAPVFQWTPGRPAVAEGVRAAIITALPLVVSIWMPLPWLSWVSLGGFIGVLGDKGGAYRTRAARFLALAALGGAAVAAGSLAGQPPALAVIAMFVAGVGLTLLRAHPTVVGAVAGQATIVFAVSLELPAAGLTASLVRALALAAGALLAMILALGIFPFRYYRPAREAVAHCYRLLAARLDELGEAARRGATPDELIAGLQRANPPLREALEHARTTLSATRYGREAESERGERLLVLVETADQLAAVVMSLTDAIETSAAAAAAGGTTTATLAARLSHLAGRCRRVAAEAGERRGSPAQAADDAAAVARAGQAVAPDIGDPAVAPLLARFELFLAGAEEAAALLEASSGTSTISWMLPRVGVPRWKGWSAPLRDELNLQSIPMRHALRTGVVAALAVALVRALHIPYGQWVTLVALIVLQPYVAATTVKGLQRVLGTIAGGVLAALIGPAMHAPLASVPIIFLLAGVAVAVFPLNYAAYALFSTPTFVLLTELRAGSWHLASVRSADTLVGAALALAGSALLWPTRERGRAPSVLAAAIRAVRDYAAYVTGSRTATSTPASTSTSASAPASLTAARRRVSLALLDADVGVRRLLAERPPGSPGVEARMTVLAYTRRLAMSLTALAVMAEEGWPVSRRPVATSPRRSTLARPTLARPTLARPTLARPTHPRPTPGRRGRSRRRSSAGWWWTRWTSWRRAWRRGARRRRCPGWTGWSPARPRPRRGSAGC